MIDSNCNKYALELVHNRKVNIPNSSTAAFSYIYQQIINISRNAPVYLIYPTEDIQLFATQIKALSMELGDFIKRLSDTDSSNPLRQLRLVPPPQEFLTAKLVGQPETPAEYKIHISSVAKGQLNQSNPAPKKLCPFTSRTYTFMIQFNEKRVDFEVPVTNSSSNEIILNQIANLINQTATDLDASLKIEDSKVTLILQANANRKNKPAVFTIKDTEPNGLISYYGIDNLEASPVRSQFSVNGKTIFSYGTAFVIDDLFELSLIKPCEQDIQLNFELDTQIISNEINKLQVLINQLLMLAHSSTKNTLERELLSILAEHKQALAKVGIELDDASTLTTNPEQLENSILDTSLEQLFSGNEPFTADLLEHTQDITLDPMKYVPNKIVSYKDYTKINYPNPYLLSIYSGFIFTSYC